MIVLDFFYRFYKNYFEKIRCLGGKTSGENKNEKIIQVKISEVYVLCAAQW